MPMDDHGCSTQGFWKISQNITQRSDMAWKGVQSRADDLDRVLGKEFCWGLALQEQSGLARQKWGGDSSRQAWCERSRKTAGSCRRMTGRAARPSHDLSQQEKIEAWVQCPGSAHQSTFSECSTRGSWVLHKALWGQRTQNHYLCLQDSKTSLKRSAWAYEMTEEHLHPAASSMLESTWHGQVRLQRRVSWRRQTHFKGGERARLAERWQGGHFR